MTPTTESPDLTIEEHLADLAESGLTTAAFARARGIPAWKLYNALRKRNGGPARRRKRSALVPVVLKSQTGPSNEPIELVLAGGHRLRIPSDFDAGALRRLMGVLAGC